MIIIIIIITTNKNKKIKIMKNNPLSGISKFTTLSFRTHRFPYFLT